MSYDCGWQSIYQGCQPTPDCLLIELDGLTFTGKHQPGAYYGITGWSGWIEAPDTKGGAAAYESADGGSETPVYHQGRGITLEGRIEALTRQELWQMAADLGVILTSNRWAPMEVTEDALDVPTRMIRVRRTRSPRVTFDSWTSAIFTLELESAGYPRLDAAQSTAKLAMGEAKTVENLGDYPASVSATLTGPLVNPTITWPGGVWTYTGSIPAGEQRVVSFSNRNVRDPASARNYRLSASGQWPKADPGSATWSLSGSGSGSVSLYWRSSWN